MTEYYVYYYIPEDRLIVVNFETHWNVHAYDRSGNFLSLGAL